jgi:hypothetical protein
MVKREPVRKKTLRLDDGHIHDRWIIAFNISHRTGPGHHRAKPDFQLLAQCNYVLTINRFAHMDPLAYQATEIQFQLQKQGLCAFIKQGLGLFADSEFQGSPSNRDNLFHEQVSVAGLTRLRINRSTGCTVLLDAAEAFISAGRWLESRKAAALCYRASRKQFKEVFHASSGVKLFLKGIMQLA